MKSAPVKLLLGLSLCLSLAACSGMNTRATADSGPAAPGSNVETYDNPNYYYLFDCTSL